MYGYGLLIILIIYIISRKVYFIIQRNFLKNTFKNNVVILNNNTYKKNDNYKDVNQEKLKMFNTDNIELLKTKFYNIFYEFECAYNNLDYNTMKILSTKQLFQNYYTGIILDLKVGHKRIIKDIKRKSVIIYELDSTSVKQVVSVMIEVQYVNYVIDKNGKVISNAPTTESFEVEFRKVFDDNGTYKCPNCGAMVEGKQCEYCRLILSDVDFKISSIRKIVTQNN